MSMCIDCVLQIFTSTMNPEFRAISCLHDDCVPPVIWVGQFAHLYVRFVSMKRMYIIVEAQGDWHSLSVSVLNRYSTNRASTMYIQMISYLYCNLIELYSKCIALILSMWYIGGSFGTRPCEYRIHLVLMHAFIEVTRTTCMQVLY